MKSILLFSFCICFLFAKAQKEGNQWVMSDYGYPHNLVDFNTGFADTSTFLSSMDMFLTNACISDSNGQILFYTNGCKIENRNHDSLFNSSGFNPGWVTNFYQPNGMGVPQACFVIPRPDHYGQYFLFHESGEITSVGGTTAAQPRNLSYSLIDMNLDSGLGGIVVGMKNIHAYDDTLIYGRVTGTRHGNGRDWWIVAHKSNSDKYNKLLVTPDSMMVITQQIGRTHNWERFTQQACFSPTGDKYVIELTADTNFNYGNIVDLFDFDRCTGDLSNFRNIIVPDSFWLATGCSFSPNGRFLYINTPIRIYQYDTWNVNINASRLIVAIWDSFMAPNQTKFYYQQFAPDGKIYISTTQSSNILHYIDKPDSLDTACEVIQNSFYLPVINSFVMPNMPNYALGPAYGSVCDSLSLGIANNESFDLELKIYPNPNDGRFVINYVLPQNKSGEFSIYDVTGKVVFKSNLTQWSNQQIFVLPDLFGGVYNCVFISEGYSASKKLVVIK